MAEPEADVKDVKDVKETTPEDKDKKKKPMMQSALVKTLMVALGFLLIMIAAGWIAYSVTQRFRGSEGQGIEPGLHKPGGTETLLAPEIFDMGEFTLIISDESGRSYNLKTTVLLTINQGGSRSKADVDEVKKEIGERKEQLRDAVSEVLYGMDPQNFVGSSSHRVEGLAEMKASIVREVNTKMKLKIDGVLLPQGIIFQ